METEQNNYREPSSRTILLTMVLAFVVPVTIMVLALLKVQIWPGGKFTLFIYDMRSQFSPVISSMRYIGKGDNSLFLSFYGALANNAFLIYTSYMIDPTMWLSVFFPLEAIPDFIYFATVFKIGLCGVAASAYFYFGIKEKKHPFVILILSICYALMSYNIMYSQCILWFNVIALAPIILIGIERIIEGKRGCIYILCMTLSLYFNMQLTFMVGIFSIMYLIFRLSENIQSRAKVLGRFVISNILSAGLFMPACIPVILNTVNGRMQTENYMQGWLFYYPIGEVLKQFLSSQDNTLLNGGYPNLFCGTFVPIIALLAVIIPVKPVITRLVSGAMIIFFLASFCIIPLNQFWHGFNEPNSFPARYSFLLCLFLIILAYHVICYVLEKRNPSQITLRILYGVAMAVACTELYLNAGFILTSLNIEFGYGINASYQRRLSDLRDALSQIDDDGFFRIGRDVSYGYNEGMRLGYNGIGFFSSLYERKPQEFIGMLGYSQSEHALSDAGGTPIAESLLGVKYKVMEYPDLFGYYENKYSNHSYNVQYNPNALPLGFLINYDGSGNIIDRELENGVKEQNSFSFQEYILTEICGSRTHAFENIKYSCEDVDSDEYGRYIKMSFTATSDKPVWIYCSDYHDGVKIGALKPPYTNTSSDQEIAPGSDNEPVKAILKVNGEERYPFIDSLSTMCIYLGTFKAGEKVTVEAACTNAFDDPWIVYYDEAEGNRALSSIKDRGFKVSKHGNGKLSGTIHINDANELMVLTLPYMKGYMVKVDGNRTGYGAFHDALFALKIEPGDHTVEISYIPYGLIPGSVIGSVFFLITLLYLRKGRTNPA